MSRKIQILLVLTVIALFQFPSCTESPSFAKEGDLAGFFQKKEVTIAVTDSGLGGLAVMAEAVEKMKKTKAFASLGVRPKAFLNPNSNMLNFLFEPRYQNRYEETATSVSLVSMVEISPDRIDSIGRWLEGVSSQTAGALRHYMQVEDLFSWKEFIQRNGEIPWLSAGR